MTASYYHRTYAADPILAGGFRDGEGNNGLLRTTLRGVWISDQPLDENEGAWGDTLLRLTLPDGVDLTDYELIEDEKPYREWCVPAAVLNAAATLQVIVEDDEQ